MTKSVENRIDELKAELAELEEEQNAIKLLSKEQQLAIKLHAAMCRGNHVDGCSWYYADDFKVDTWKSDYAHIEWLEHANQLISFCDQNNISIDLAMDFIELVKRWH